MAALGLSILGRLVSWYTKGGFTDEFGVFHKSGLYYNISHWEVLNEVNYEHGMSPQYYTDVYDSISYKYVVIFALFDSQTKLYALVCFGGWGK